MTAHAVLGECRWHETFVTPGETHWVSMFGTADETVSNASSTLLGAENIPFEGVEHSGANGLLDSDEVWVEVVRALEYPCW